MTNQIIAQGYIGSNMIITQGYSIGVPVVIPQPDGGGKKQKPPEKRLNPRVRSLLIEWLRVKNYA